jgi:hypothetical protein
MGTRDLSPLTSSWYFMAERLDLHLISSWRRDYSSIGRTYVAYYLLNFSSIYENPDCAIQAEIVRDFLCATVLRSDPVSNEMHAHGVTRNRESWV